MTAEGGARGPSMREVLGVARKQSGYVRLGDLPPRVARIIATCEGARIDAWRRSVARGLAEDESLELYLNCIPLARDVFGLGEGARVLFGKRTAELTVNEAVLVAATASALHLRKAASTPVTSEMHHIDMLGQLVEHGVVAADEAADIARRLTTETSLDLELAPARARGADVFEGKSAEGLVAYAHTQFGAAYWWGTYGRWRRLGCSTTST